MTSNLKLLAISTWAAFFSFLVAIPANAAATNFDNLTATTAGSDPLASVGPLADSFSTAGYSTTLNQVSVKLLADAPSGSGSVTLQLLSNSSNTPGIVLSSIGTLSDSNLSTALADYTLTLSTPYSLTTDTRYWVELTSDSSSAEWAWSYDDSGPGVANEYLSNANGTFFNATNAPYQMEVVTASPEPSSLAVLGLGLVTAGAMIRKRRIH